MTRLVTHGSDIWKLLLLLYCPALDHQQSDWRSVSLASEAGAFCEVCLAPSGCGQHSPAAGAGHHCLGMAENSRHLEASRWTLDVHKVAVGGLHKPLELVLLQEE